MDELSSLDRSRALPLDVEPGTGAQVWFEFLGLQPKLQANMPELKLYGCRGGKMLVMVSGANDVAAFEWLNGQHLAGLVIERAPADTLIVAAEATATPLFSLEEGTFVAHTRAAARVADAIPSLGLALPTWAKQSPFQLRSGELSFGMPLHDGPSRRGRRRAIVGLTDERAHWMVYDSDRFEGGVKVWLGPGREPMEDAEWTVGEEGGFVAGKPAWLEAMQLARQLVGPTLATPWPGDEVLVIDERWAIERRGNAAEEPTS